MRYTVSCNSDIGRSRKVNQDAIAVKHILIHDSEVVFAVLCDGMGGLSDGELASSSVVKALIEWFDKQFCKGFEQYNDETIVKELNHIIKRINSRIFAHGKKSNNQLGTTLTAILIINNRYIIANVGDCRAYLLNDEIRQITVDHSVVEREIQAGRLKREDARFDKRRNQLTRSIGVLEKVEADFYKGKIEGEEVFLLCCDGVRTKIYDDELLYYFHPTIMTSKASMENNIKYIFELNKTREENDNMSIVLIKDSGTTISLQDVSEEIVIVSEKTIVNSKDYIGLEE